MKARAVFGLAFAFLGLASWSSGHPMGNFSVNRYARLEPSEREIGLVYIVDFAEIPTFQEISRFPDLASDTSAEGLNRNPKRSALAAELAKAWAPGLRLTESSRAIRLQPRQPSLEFSPGAGGLPTMKLRLNLAGSWPRGAATGTLEYRDTNAPERLGWREVVVRAGPGLALSGDFSTVDRSRELTNYPADPTADIPQTVAASLNLRLARSAPGPAVGHPAERSRASDPGPSVSEPGGWRGATPLLPLAARRRSKVQEFAASGKEGRVPRQDPPDSRSAGAGPRRSASGPLPVGPMKRSDRFSDLVSREHLTPGIVLLSLLIAACLGGLHALSPGHGKTVVAAYLVGSRGTAKHALLLGLVVTASHTIGVFLLGIVTLALSKAIVPEKLYPAIQFLSGLTIVAIGLSLFVKRFRRGRSAEHGHSHAVEVPETAPTASALLALGVSGGILPCPSALVVLLSAIALHRVGFGLVLIVAFSAGLAAVLSGIGILVVRAGKLLSRFEPAGRWARRLPAFSALLIGVLGLVIAARAFADVQRAFF